MCEIQRHLYKIMCKVCKIGAVRQGVGAIIPILTQCPPLPKLALKSHDSMRACGCQAEFIKMLMEAA